MKIEYPVPGNYEKQICYNFEIDHILNVSKCLSEVFDILQEGELIIIRRESCEAKTPCFYSNLINIFPFNIIFRNFILNIIWFYTVKRRLYNLSELRILNLLNKNGFKIIEHEVLNNNYLIIAAKDSLLIV